MKDRAALGKTLAPLSVRFSAAHVIGGAITSRDWQPQHHDRDRAQVMHLRDVILNTPSQLGWFCRFATDWSGPHGRVGRSSLRMRRPICPGDEVLFEGCVVKTVPDPAGWNWSLLDLSMKCLGKIVSSCRIWIAIPQDDDALPWMAKSDAWNPPELEP